MTHRTPFWAMVAAGPRILLLAGALALVGCGPAAGDGPSASPWQQYAAPVEAGFDSAALASVCDYADSVQSAAVMAVSRGHVVVVCGAVDRELEAHSVRKSLVSALYGTAVERGEIDLDATLAELGIGDDRGLTDLERAATVRDVISARSGVYLPAAYAPSSQDENRPERGAYPPGEHWFYNNWDFNVAGVIYQSATGEDLYESFDHRIAAPVGMQDYDPDDGFVAYEPGLSLHPAHTFRISTRDLARFGQLYLQEGRWGAQQVLSAAWVRESTRPVSELGSGQGYGYMWWTYDSGSIPTDRYPAISRYDVYQARGTGSQALWVIPEAELVIVHRADTDHGREIAGPDAWTIADGIVAAMVAEAEPADEPELAPMTPTPFETQLPPYDWPEPSTVPDAVLDDYMGEYPLAPEAVIRVFRFRGEPYIHVPGEGEARLVPLGSDAFTIRVVAGVHASFLRDETGAVAGIEITLDPPLGPQTLHAPKR